MDISSVSPNPLKRKRSNCESDTSMSPLLTIPTWTSTPEESKSTDRVNPSEAFCLDNLKSSIFSPSILASSTPTPVSESCIRNVQEISKLSSIQLEESPSSSPYTNPYPIDSSTEPQTEDVMMTDVFRRGPGPPVASMPTPTYVSRKSRKTRRAVVAMSDSWTNTELSLPPDIPPELELLFGPHFGVTCCSESMIPTEVEEEANRDEEGIEDERYLQSSPILGVDRSEGGHMMGVRRRLDLSFGDVFANILNMR